MNRPLRRTLALVPIAAAFSAALLPAAPWSRRVQVTHGGQVCISYRARHAAGLLILEATPGKGWHTFVMDNPARAAEKLAGKKALGIELPTQFSVAGALEVDGPWFQSPPRDFSRPEQRWFSWGFDSTAVFAAKALRSGPGKATIGVRGQACTDAVCKNIDVSLEIATDPPEASGGPPPVDLKTLEQVRR
jgi:hypothetical protein